MTNPSIGSLADRANAEPPTKSSDKTQVRPPQPAHRYREIAPSSDSDDMSGSENNSIPITTAPSSHPSPSPLNQPYQLVNHSRDLFAGVDSSQIDQDMITDELTEPRATKRKRADTSPDDSDAPASNRSYSVDPLQTPPPNQLGQSGVSLSAHVPHPPSTTTPAIALQNNSSAPRSPFPEIGFHRRVGTRLTKPNIKNVDVTGFLGESPLIGLDPRSVNTWKTIQGFKALVYPHDAAFEEDDKVKIGANMERAVALYLNGASLVVTAPEALSSFVNRKPDNCRPWCYLISQLTEESHDTIIKVGFIANQHAVLHVIPFTPKPSHYIGRIKNLTLDATLHHKVVKLIQKTLSDDTATMDYITTFIANHHDLIPKDVFKSRSAVNWVIKSVRAFNIQSEGQVGKEYSQWNWYIFTPTSIQEHVERWISTLAKVRFDSGIFGVGKTILNTKCSRCKSTNHFDVECPFTNRSPFIDATPTKKSQVSSRGGRGGRRGFNNNGSRGRK